MLAGRQQHPSTQQGGNASSVLADEL